MRLLGTRHGEAGRSFIAKSEFITIRTNLYVYTENLDVIMYPYYITESGFVGWQIPYHEDKELDDCYTELFFEPDIP